MKDNEALCKPATFAEAWQYQDKPEKNVASVLSEISEGFDAWVKQHYSDRHTFSRREYQIMVETLTAAQAKLLALIKEAIR